MFGTLRPPKRGTCAERRELNRFYCGLCKGLGHHHGTLMRGVLSYDGVFIGLLTDALVEEAAEHDKCRCPMLPIVHRPIVRPDSVAMRFAASVQMLLVDQWVADGQADVADGPASPKKVGLSIVRRVSSPHAESAHAELDKLGVSLRELEKFEELQSSVERTRGGGGRTRVTAEEAAEPTAWALGIVFSRIAQLCRREDQHDTLTMLGRSVGRVIYLVDALEDLEKDRKDGSFNPCIAPKERRRACALLERDVNAIGDALDQLPIRRHHDSLRRILREELPRRVHSAMTSPIPAPSASLSLSKATFVRMAMAIALFFWAWLCAVPRVLAAKPVPPHDAGKQKDASSEPEAPDASSAGFTLPPLPPSTISVPTGTPATPAPTNTSSGSSSSGGGCNPKKKGAEPPGGGGASSSSGGEGGGGSCDACSKCTGECARCCKDPGSCCSCKECGDCGKCCGDCGKCCDGCGSCCK